MGKVLKAKLYAENVRLILCLAVVFQELTKLSESGDVDGLQRMFEITIPSLPEDQRKNLCKCLGAKKNCSLSPCLNMVRLYTWKAVRASQLTAFEYLWDRFLGPAGILLYWELLEPAASRGLIGFAKSFWARDSMCFSKISPDAAHGPLGGNSQIDYAVSNDHFEYADYMLAHGADINVNFPNTSRIRYAIQEGGPIGNTHRVLFVL